MPEPLYRLTGAYADLVADDEPGEDWQARLEALQDAIPERVEACLKARAILHRAGEGYAAEEARFERLKDSAQDRVKGIDAYLARCLTVADIAKVPTAAGVCTLVAGSERCEVYDAESIPRHLWRTPDPSPAVSEIKAALKRGEEVPGARIVRGPATVRIR